MSHVSALSVLRRLRQAPVTGAVPACCLSLYSHHILHLSLPRPDHGLKSGDLQRSGLSTMGGNNNIGRRFDLPISVDGSSNTEISASSPTTPYCKHGLNVYVRTSWTADNPGRHFFACPIQDDTKQCNFFQWVDGEWDGRAYAALTKMHRKWQTTEKECAAVRQRSFMMTMLF